MVNNIIKNDSQIVMNETQVHLTDEKLKGILLKAYERGQKDSTKRSFSDWYSVFLSIAGTLFLSLITSEFGDILLVPAKTVTLLAWIVFIVSALLGFVLLGIHVSRKTHTNTEKRDTAVDEMFSHYAEQ